MKIRELFNQKNIEFNRISFENFQSVSIDSRDIKKDNIFCALNGEKSDGHNYIESAIKNGALCAIVERDYIEKNSQLKKFPLIIADNSLKALQKSAKIYGELINTKILAITGSAGKTTTRKLICKVLESKYSVSQTKKNYNNHIGLPLSILEIDENDDYAIIEMGANHVGEIASLCEIIKPDFGLITSISEAHIEGFGSIENIQKTKFELFDSVKNDGYLFINNDDERIRNYDNFRKSKITYGIKSDADYKLSIVNIDNFGIYTLKYKDKKIRLNSIGYGAVLNASASFAVGKKFGLSTDLIIQQLEFFETPKGRGNIIKLDGFSIIDDTYNASPKSVNLAIETLDKMNSDGKKIMVFGDMLEMGDLSESTHINIGVKIAKSNIDYLFCYGENSKLTIDSARNYKMTNAIYFDNKKNLSKTLNSIIKTDDIVYVKGSRGIKMEIIIDELKKLRQNNVV
ncbi:MAG: UDP-N-acetylmuramoyl-tripeptide--D-alanyl-D-alanine ligase [Candidatus Marinimicrobia bacterium]|nr:UDP-N-acetylmuramoyl-tripeptide--D-alanyl-D-alanine ligase [Candidatus Neomarinimicrobiota bacterium]